MLLERGAYINETVGEHGTPLDAVQLADWKFCKRYSIEDEQK
jgi:hypothetical protein